MSDCREVGIFPYPVYNVVFCVVMWLASFSYGPIFAISERIFFKHVNSAITMSGPVWKAIMTKLKSGES